MVGVGLAAGLTGGIYAFSKQELKVERRLKNMVFNGNEFTEIREGVGVCVEGNCSEKEPIKELSPIEKEKINCMIQGMSEQEIRVVLQNIPVGLMFDEIGARLAAHEHFAMSIQDALKCLPR